MSAILPIAAARTQLARTAGCGSGIKAPNGWKWARCRLAAYDQTRSSKTAPLNVRSPRKLPIRLIKRTIGNSLIGFQAPTCRLIHRETRRWTERRTLFLRRRVHLVFD